MSLKLTREADLAEKWELSLEHFRHLRRKNGWPRVELSRQDIRYTDAQIEHIVQQMTVIGHTPKATTDSGQTAASARRTA